MRRHRERLGVTFWLLNENGSSMIELAVVLPLLLLMLIGAVDIGREYEVALAVASAASAGAQYGTWKPTDILGMQQAATMDANYMVGLVPIATWGCQCSDGSSVTPLCGVTPSCATNAVRYVQVTTTLTYTPLFAWPGVPSPVVLKGRSIMRAAN